MPARAPSRAAGSPLEIVRERLDIIGVQTSELRFDLIGVDAVHRGAGVAARRTRGGARCASPAAPRAWPRRCASANEVETLYTNGPAGGGGASKSAREVVAVVSGADPARAGDAVGHDADMLTLHALAHARTGDKGNISNISVIAYDPGDFAFLCEHVTAERVRRAFRRHRAWRGRALRVARVGRAEFRDARRAGRRRHALAGAGRARQKPEFLPVGDGIAGPPETVARPRLSQAIPAHRNAPNPRHAAVPSSSPR